MVTVTFEPSLRERDTALAVVADVPADDALGRVVQDRLLERAEDRA